MLSCAAILTLAVIVLFIGTLLIFGLISVAVAVVLLALVVVPLAIILLWRRIYPWLVRMGRWSAQLRNIIFLFLALLVGGFILSYILSLAGIPISRRTIYILLGILFFFLLFLGIVVWLVRLWRYGWPRSRNVFWDICFRIVALVWKILVGIPLGIVWFFYHPPLRWLVATILFYLRGTSAAAAWLLYNPPLRDIMRAGLFIMRLIARFTAWLLYNPPIRWVMQFGLFILRMLARFLSTIIYGIMWPYFINGVREVLRKGLTAERKSYQDYKYAHDDSRSAA
jgi:hypothetical protein